MWIYKLNLIFVLPLLIVTGCSSLAPKHAEFARAPAEYYPDPNKPADPQIPECYLGALLDGIRDWSLGGAQRRIDVRAAVGTQKIDGCPLTAVWDFKGNANDVLVYTLIHSGIAAGVKSCKYFGINPDAFEANGISSNNDFYVMRSIICRAKN